jgi:predicted nuclease of predicted toxin-antitoxin system
LKKPKKPLQFFLDASVPDSVGKVLTGAGFPVIYHREALTDGTKDPVVCQTALEDEAVLVAVDADMRQLTKRFGKTEYRFQKLDLIMCSCNAVMTAKRVEQALSLIEHEWRDSQTKASKRLWVEITNHHILTYR